MPVPVEIELKYSQLKPYVDLVAERVKQIILSFTEKKGYAFASRLKNSQSLAEKIETGRFKSWSTLDDTFGCSIVFPTLGEEPSVFEYISSKFLVVEHRERGSTLKDPSVFRFDATRVIATLNPTVSGLDEQSLLLNIPFEIQLRTAFEHAWSSTTHKVAYKGDRIDWKYLRLAAQLKAAVEQLDLMAAGYDKFADLISAYDWPEIIIKSSIEDFFRTAIETGKIPSEMQPQSWSRFCDNIFSLIRSISKQRKMNEKQVVKEVLSAIQSGIEDYQKRPFPRSISLTQFVIGTLVRRKVFEGNLEKYHILITNSFIDLFPEVKNITNGFDLEVS
jgi:ppGpp synthetase/RelA/SpoT-type nucleotidyltranferase